ncbi:MAG: hypothetical protein ACU84Q_06950 [Gammaproteobacteria bacterium]
MIKRHLIAHNDAADSGNPMHDADAARSMGFKGAIVPGVTIYGYMTHLFLDYFGERWLQNGFSQVRFRQPIFADEPIQITGHEEAGVDSGILNVKVINSDGSTAAVGAGSMNAEVASAFKTDGALYSRDYPIHAERAATKLPPTKESLATHPLLGSFVTDLTFEKHRQFCIEMRDQHSIYERALHPAWLLRQANIIVDENFNLGAWIHTESEISSLGLARCGQTIEVRAEAVDLFERKGNEYVDLDVAFFQPDDSNTPILRVLHRAIYLPNLSKT